MKRVIAGGLAAFAAAAFLSLAAHAARTLDAPVAQGSESAEPEIQSASALPATLPSVRVRASARRVITLDAPPASAKLFDAGAKNGTPLKVGFARPVDALFALEEALKCRALSVAIAELHGEAADLTATRRLILAAREGGVLGLLLRPQPSEAPSAAATRWQAAGCPSEPDELGGLGRTAFTLSLTRNRRGPVGRWTVAWDHHEQAFSALSRGVAEAARDRPDRKALGRTG